MAKILIIEDDAVLHRMYQQLLQNHGHIASVEVDGESGLKTALGTHPDLILLDIRLPKMDGLSVLKHLRHDPWGAQVPVIILTNLDANDKIVKVVLEEYPAYYLIKSNVKPDEVLEKVTSVLNSDKQK